MCTFYLVSSCIPGVPSGSSIDGGALYGGGVAGQSGEVAESFDLDTGIVNDRSCSYQDGQASVHVSDISLDQETACDDILLAIGELAPERACIKLDTKLPTGCDSSP